MSEAARGGAAPPTGFEAMFERYGSAYRPLVVITALIGTVATILSSTIVNVALPEIMGAYGIGQDRAQLISTSFLAAVTACMLLNAWAIERFGYRAAYAGSVTVFVIGSFVSGFAPSEPMMILGRVLQGAAGGLLQPFTTQVVFQVFEPAKRGQAMGITAVGVVLAPALGPAIGGLMVDGWGWRSVFFLSVPFALIGVAMGAFFLPGRDPAAPTRRFDWPGFALLSIALFALLTGLSSGQRHGWGSARVDFELGLALVAAIAFVLWELKTPAPMLNVRIFANRGFAAASAVAVVYGVGIFGTTYLAPLFVQLVQGYTATQAGLLLMPAGLMMILIFPVAGRIADRVSPVWPVTIGLVFFVVSSFLLAGVDTETTFWTMAIWILVGRIGLGLTMPSMNASALRSLPPQWLGQGAGAINFTRQFGGAIGVNLLSIVLEQHIELHAQTLTATQHPGNPATMETLRMIEGLMAQDGVPDGVRQAGALDYLARIVLAQAMMLGFRDSFHISAYVFLLAMLPALFMRRARQA
ncbi:MAG TPA: DHA2 family efflux MFS transporter permease subunit [Acetobacteraceae bacterium]|nr:DHA2 family efflux MFS transporter permease subunit [Acetobacteraceae bacterium]